jgi:hypothetical protein
MRPDDSWIEQWSVGHSPAKEDEASRELLRIFRKFWTAEELDRKSKSTRSRYAGSLHALGSQLVEKVGYTDLEVPIGDHLGEGPLIWQENEAWQRELDATCGKLERFLCGE